MSNIGFIDWNAFDPDAFAASMANLTAADFANVETDLNQGIINLNKNPELASTPEQKEYVRTNVSSRQTSGSNNNPAPATPATPATPVISAPSTFTGTITDTLRSSSSDYANKNQDLQPGAEMYKGDGAYSTGASTSNPPIVTSAMNAQSQSIGQGATANPPGEFPSDRYSAAVKNLTQVNNNSNSNPVDVYNAMREVAEIAAPYENNPDGGYGVTVDYWMRNLSGAPDVVDNYNAYVAEGGSASGSGSGGSSNQDREPMYVDQSGEITALNERIAELEKLVAGNQVLDSTDNQLGNLITKRNERFQSGSGIIPNIISQNSILSNANNLTVGGEVYGPDGSVYPSVTAAIQAGVFNYSYFPMPTGVVQGEGGQNTTRRSYNQESMGTTAEANPALRFVSG